MRILNQNLLEDDEFWKHRGIERPNFDRRERHIEGVCFSVGRMAYAHTGDIVQDVASIDKNTGLLVGVETFNPVYYADLVANDYLVVQMIFGDRRGEITSKMQAAIKDAVFVGDRRGVSWTKLMMFADDPRVKYATINAPEGTYGVIQQGDSVLATSPAVIADMSDGTISSDLAKWTAFALRRYESGLPFAFVSCTNFPENGRFLRTAMIAMASAWESIGSAPSGFARALADPQRFGFPNTMIDRIAVPPDETSHLTMRKLGILSSVVVTEKTRYWVVEDSFPGGRPPFELADGVIIVADRDEVRRCEEMKLRILNMSHSVIATVGLLLGYRGKFGICRAMQDEDVRSIIDRIIEIVLITLDRPSQMQPEKFARETIARLNNPNIPDDPMRIALNGSTKIAPRFMNTYYSGLSKGISRSRLRAVLLPVAAFFRYLIGRDDQWQEYEIQDDPWRDELIEAGRCASLGDPDSAQAFVSLVSDPRIMGEQISSLPEVVDEITDILREMLEGPGSVRKTLRRQLGT